MFDTLYVSSVRLIRFNVWILVQLYMKCTRQSLHKKKTIDISKLNFNKRKYICMYVALLQIIGMGDILVEEKNT